MKKIVLFAVVVFLTGCSTKNPNLSQTYKVDSISCVQNESAYLCTFRSDGVMHQARSKNNHQAGEAFVTVQNGKIISLKPIVNYGHGTKKQNGKTISNVPVPASTSISF